MTLFAYPWMLLALLPAAALIYYIFFRKAQAGVILPELVSLQKTGRSGLPRVVAPLFSGILLSLALILLILASARPRLGNEKIIMRHKGIDIIMVLDLSGSMAAYDVPENIVGEKNITEAFNSGRMKNRLEVAKDELSKFIARRPNDRIGLIGFAEFGYTLSPPTLDHSWLSDSLSMLEPGIIGDATGIASPLASAIRRLDKSEAPRRVMVLFTDGVNNVTHRLTPLETATLAKEKNITIYTVGIGGNNAFALQDSFFGRQLVRVNSNFDEKLLQEIAAVTNGKYFRANDAQALNSVMNEINQLEKTNFEQPRYIEYSEFAPLLAVAAIILIMGAMWLENTYERTVP